MSLALLYNILNLHSNSSYVHGFLELFASIFWNDNMDLGEILIDILVGVALMACFVGVFITIVH
jgi:hypothetical protein